LPPESEFLVQSCHTGCDRRKRGEGPRTSIMPGKPDAAYLTRGPVNQYGIKGN